MFNYLCKLLFSLFSKNPFQVYAEEEEKEEKIFDELLESVKEGAEIIQGKKEPSRRFAIEDVSNNHIKILDNKNKKR